MSWTEDQITAWFADQRKLSYDDFPIGIGDDMAQIQVGKGTSVFITIDMLLDGVHFDLRKATLQQAGYKAMAVSLSDCAAMAVLPVAAVVSVALPKGFSEKKLKQLHKGIILAADKYNCALVGGDITSWKTNEPFAITVAMLGRAAANKPIKRSGAKPGDCICVTGFLGGSSRGKHLSFEPRVNEAVKIAAIAKVNSMIDISDGLSSDLNRICRQSKTGALIYAGQIPISREARKSKEPLKSALNDGEDFELLFTLAEKEFKKLIKHWDSSLPVTKIGTVTNTGKMQIQTAGGKLQDLQTGGYEHLG
jgi:thiamine-monophosphate kinase